MEQQYRLEGKKLIVYMPRELDHHVAQTLCVKLDTLIEVYGVKELEFDFSDTEFMDSSGIGLVMGRYKLIKSLGGEIRVENLSPSAYKIMHLAGMERLGEIRQKETVQ